jgi:hypothetical protein
MEDRLPLGFIQAVKIGETAGHGFPFRANGSRGDASRSIPFLASIGRGQRFRVGKPL